MGCRAVACDDVGWSNDFPNEVEANQLCRWSASSGTATNVRITRWRCDFNVAYNHARKKRSSLGLTRFGESVKAAIVSRIKSISGNDAG